MVWEGEVLTPLESGRESLKLRRTRYRVLDIYRFGSWNDLQGFNKGFVERVGGGGREGERGGVAVEAQKKRCVQCGCTGKRNILGRVSITVIPSKD